MKKHAKIVWKEFRRSFGRFVAILAIIAVGVGFLIGIMDTTPDMRHTLDAYYDAHAVYDVQIKTGLGLYPNEISMIKSATGVERVVAVNSLDVTAYAGGSKVAARVTGLDFSDMTMNRFDLETGRYPLAENECVAERHNDVLVALSVGDTLRVTDTSMLADKLSVKEFTVVGIVSDPVYYASTEAERTTIGSGKIGAIAYIPDTAIGMTELERKLASVICGTENVVSYTDCFVTVRGAEKKEVFTDAYEALLLDCADSLSVVGASCVAGRNEKFDALEKLLESMQDGAIKDQYAALLEQARTYAGAEWYVLPRTQNVSYASMAMNIDKVGAIAGIFPVFFIVVAALVALVTMTKMVEEDRAEIGTLKALGYSKARILSKYLIYCGAATLIGVGLGMLCGFSMLPNVIWSAYSTMYRLPALLLKFDWIFFITVPLISLAAIFAVTLYAALGSLKETPAQLMLPKAPKAGKRILLERVGFLWKPLKFKHKAMLRNIFRNKRNLVMTVVSVAGCCALMVAGFGLQDSVGAVAVKQFDELYRYDLTVEYKTDSADGPLREYLDGLGEDAYTRARKIEGNFSTGGGKEPATLYAVEPSEIGGFIEFRTRKKHTPIEFGADTVVISETLASAFGIGVGDEFTFAGKGGQAVKLKAGAVTEQYVGCAIYLPREYYETVAGIAAESNFLFVKSDAAEKDRDAVSERLLEDPSVSGVTFADSTRASYDNLLDTMIYVVLVLILSAGTLAIVVLYNLTNVNIDERKREIATLKVLGYRPAEVAGYVYRESMFSTVLGALAGLGVGALLHHFIVLQVEEASLMLGRAISWVGFVVPLLLTLAFAVIVDLVMLAKLKRIDMEDSLKTTD